MNDPHFAPDHIGVEWLSRARACAEKAGVEVDSFGSHPAI